MSKINHRFIKTNGIRMHIAEQGEGPLVVLLHGFPEYWYSWRHQISALAGAGYHAVAPDQRGYGRTDCPEAVQDYDILKLVSDIVGLVHALGREQAIVVGHDFGSQIAYNCALMRPDIFHTIALMSVPYAPRSWKSIPTTKLIKRLVGDRQFYQSYFQEPHRAEAEMDADVRKSVLMFLYSASGSPPPEKRMRFIFEQGETLLDIGTLPETLPDWLTEEDVDHFTREFTHSGFRGGINWYRNVDRNWELTAFLSGAKLNQPALFIAGEADGIVAIRKNSIKALDKHVPNLKKKVIIPGAGHWVQQETPVEVNRLLIEFLDGLRTA